MEMSEDTGWFISTANILNARNTTFHCVMISSVLQLPCWDLITVPRTTDKLQCSCIFGNYFLYHTDCSLYSQPLYKYFQKYNFSWFNDFPCTYLQCLHLVNLYTHNQKIFWYPVLIVIGNVPCAGQYF